MLKMQPDNHDFRKLSQQLKNYILRKKFLKFQNPNFNI